MNLTDKSTYEDSGKMKKIPFPVKTLVCIALALLLIAALNGRRDDGRDTAAKSIVIENGMAQPFLTYTNAQDPGYTNEGSDILRFAVYVETDYDTDLEAEAFKCVVEWLTGDRNAYTDLTGDTLIVADWSSGHVGMTGRSYAGATY